MNVFELIKEKLHKWDMQDLYLPTHFEDIVDEVAKEYPKTPTPDHPIPIDTQQYIEELEKQVKKWIPCNERLPERYEYVLCSVTDSDALHNIIISMFDNQEYWFNGRIEAWQPLPAPYKEGGSDDEPK